MLLSDILSLLYIFDNSNIPFTALQNLTPLQTMESDFLLKKLKSITTEGKFKKRIAKDPNAVLSDDEEQKLLELLASRWLRIRGTNSSYTKNSEMAANKVCIDLAKGLANTLNLQYLDILMPPLNGIANPFAIQHYTNDSNVCEFAMTDDNMMLIHIDSAFTQFQQTGTMTNSNNVELSKSEMLAVINHTKTTEKYYDLLVEKINIKTYTDTLGYELHQLILSLEHCDGQESLSLIRREFSTIISRLSDSQIEILFGAQCYNDNQQAVSFKFLWNLIADEHNQEINIGELVCQLKKILASNFILYLTPSKSCKINANLIHAANEQYCQIETAYNNEIQKVHVVLQQDHKKSDELKFVKSILSDEEGMTLYCSRKRVFKYITQLDTDDKSQCISLLLNSPVGKDYLKQSIKTMSATKKNDMTVLVTEMESQTKKQPKKQTKQTSDQLISKNSIIYIDCEESDELQTQSKPDNTKKLQNIKTSRKHVKDEDITQGKKRSAEDKQVDLNPGAKKKSKKHIFTEKINNNKQPQTMSVNLFSLAKTDDDSEIEEQFELTQAQIDEEMNNPFIAIVVDTNNMNVENLKPSKTRKKNNHVTSKIPSPEADEKEIIKTYNKAKKKLKKIQETYKADEIDANLAYENTKVLSLSAEKKAARAIEKNVKPLCSSVIKHYRDSRLFENLLQAVRITIEFINEYPVKRSIFKTEIAAIQDCLDICDSIINNPQANSISYKQEARDLKGIIQTKHIPIINYNFAIFNQRNISIQSSKIDNKNIDEINDIIKSMNFCIKYLKNSLEIYEELGDEFHIHNICNNIKKCIAKSYEDLADYQNNLLDIEYNDNSNIEQAIELLENIKSNYQSSFEFYNNHCIWLSIATCQYKLIETYIANKNPEKALAELEVLIESLANQTLSLDDIVTDDETQNIHETIETMLYAYNRAYFLTRNKNYILLAKDYLVNNTHVLKGLLSIEIIGYINELFVVKFEPQTTIDEILAKLCNNPEILEQATDIIYDDCDMVRSDDDLYIAEIANNPINTDQKTNNSEIVPDINATVLQPTEPASVSKFSFFPSMQKQQFPPVQKIPEANPLVENGYQYKPKDIEVILATRINTVPNTYALATSQLYTLLQGNCIANILQQFINEQLKHLANSNKESTLLLPVQNGSNWLGLIVSMQGTNIIGLTYFNNLPNSIMTNLQMTAIKKQLLEKNLIDKSMNITYKTSAYECNFINSELLMIENFCHIIGNQDLEPNTVLTAKKFHQRNLDALKSHNPEYYEIFSQNISSGSVMTIQQQICNRLSMQGRLFQPSDNLQQTQNVNVSSCQKF